MSDQKIKTTRVHGIYRIDNTLNGKFYIGSAINLSNRFSCHKKDLNKNQHHNTHLQTAWNKYGKEAFTFNVVEVVEAPEMLFDREQHYLDILRPYDKGVGYNKSVSSRTALGNKMSDETKKKQSEAAKQRWIRDGTESVSGENKWNAKITWDIVYQIRKLYLETDMLHGEIAKIFNLDRRHIGSVLEGRIWNDGTPPIKINKPKKNIFKLNQVQQEEIVNLFMNENGSMNQLAKKYKVSVPTIDSVLKRFKVK